MRADARRLAAQSLGRLDDKPDLAALLALEAREIDEASTARLTRIDGQSPARRGDSPRLMVSVADLGLFVSGVAFSPTTARRLRRSGTTRRILLRSMDKQMPGDPVGSQSARTDHRHPAALAFSPMARRSRSAARATPSSCTTRAENRHLGKPISAERLDGQGKGRRGVDSHRCLRVRRLTRPWKKGRYPRAARSNCRPSAPRTTVRRCWPGRPDRTSFSSRPAPRDSEGRRPRPVGLHRLEGATMMT